MSPDELLLSQTPPHLSLSKAPDADHDSLAPPVLRRSSLIFLQKLMDTSGRSTTRAQSWYKKNCHASIKLKRFTVSSNIQFFLRCEQTEEDDSKPFNETCLTASRHLWKFSRHPVVVIRQDEANIPVLRLHGGCFSISEMFAILKQIFV